jgi:hypothetical protein
MYLVLEPQRGEILIAHFNQFLSIDIQLDMWCVIGNHIQTQTMASGMLNKLSLKNEGTQGN